MKIIFDATCLMPEKITGIGVYAQQLLLQLIQKKPYDVRCVFKGSRFFSKNSSLQKVGRSASPYFSPIQDLFLDSKTIFHGPDFKMLCKNKKVHRVVTVHDLVVFHEGYNSPDFREKGQEAMDYLLNKITPHHIIVPTSVIAQELTERFPKYHNKITTIHHGADHLYQETVQEQFKDKINTQNVSNLPYFLFVGHLENRKNLLRMIKAFEIFCERNKDFNLIIIGKDGFGSGAIHDLIQSSKYRSRLILLGYVTQNELKYFYQNAQAFIFASLYEGFGFPIIEAMIENCPVITSNYGAMKEVAGEAALFVNPLDVEAISESFHQILDQDIRLQLIQKGQSRAKAFLWSKNCDETLKVYHNIS